MNTITLEKAKEALIASEKKASELGITVSTVVVDEYGMMIAMSHMDGALHISPRFAYAKAFTSASLRLPSKDVASFAQEGKPYFSINTSFGGELMVIAGGIPVKSGEKVIGAVGVGGSNDPDQDAQCAQAAVDALSH